MTPFAVRSLIVSEPARARLLAAIDEHGALTTRQILAAGLSPRAASNMLGEGLLDVGPSGFCRPPAEAERPTEKGALRKPRLSRTCDMEKCALRVSAHSPEIATLVARCPKAAERAILRAFRWTDPAKTVAALMSEAVAAERANRFGTSRLLRRMHDIIAASARVRTVEDTPDDDVSEAA